MNTTHLMQWFSSAQRELPWRNDRTPYRVWVSEVMLQQTRASVVIPYFERWMTLFPTIKTLAEAPLEQIIKAWEGLGYYSRARNLHCGAQIILRDHNGEIPDDPKALSNIKGLGPYTIGAILSFAFHKRNAAVDGNVTRVLARYYQIEEDIGTSATKKVIHQLAQEILPEQNSWIFNEALIELGATICTRSPLCQECPLKNTCRGFINGKAPQLPYKSKKLAISLLYRTTAVISHRNQILVRKVEKGEIMSDLYEFPYFETDEQGWSAEQLQQTIEKRWNLPIETYYPLPEVSHTFTRYRVRLRPFLLHATSAAPIPGYTWMPHTKLSDLPFSSGHRRILAALQTAVYP